MGALVKILFLGLSLSAQSVVGMDSEPLLLHKNEQIQPCAKTKDAVELPFLGIASCAVYKFCRCYNKKKAKCTEPPTTQAEIVSSQLSRSELASSVNIQRIAYIRDKDNCGTTTGPFPSDSPLKNSTTKPRAFTPSLTVIVPPSPVSSIRFCNSRPTPRILADGKFIFW